MADSLSTCSNLVWNVGALHPNFHHPRLKSRGVVMVVGDEFQSQLCLTTQYTNGERLEGLRCCELPESVSTHTIWVRKVSMAQAKLLVPSHQSWNWKIGCDDHFSSHIPISTMCNLSSYLWREIGRVEMLWIAWISQYTLNLGAKSGFGPSQICTHSWPENRLWWLF